MKKVKIIFYNIFFFFLFLLVLDFLASRFIIDSEKLNCYKIDQFYYELKKNCSGKHQFKSGFPTVPVFTDELGLRTSKNPIKNKKSNVLVFGDSMTFGVGLNYEDTFVGILEKNNPNYNFYNFSVGSYSPTVHLYKLKKAIENNIYPEKIILFLDLSDIYDEGDRWMIDSNTNKPKLKTDVTFRTRVLQKKKFTHRNFKITKSIIDKIKYNSRILRQKINKIKNEGEKIKIVKTSIQAQFTYTKIDDVHADYWSKEIFSRGLIKIKKNIDQIAKLAKENNSEFYLVIYPFGETLEYGQSIFNWENFSKDLCSKNNCKLVNTFKEFRERKEVDKFWYSNLYFIGDEHLNKNGNAFVTNILLKEIF